MGVKLRLADVYAAFAIVPGYLPPLFITIEEVRGFAAGASDEAAEHVGDDEVRVVGVATHKPGENLGLLVEGVGMDKVGGFRGGLPGKVIETELVEGFGAVGGEAVSYVGGVDAIQDALVVPEGFEQGNLLFEVVADALGVELGDGLEALADLLDLGGADLPENDGHDGDNGDAGDGGEEGGKLGGEVEANGVSDAPVDEDGEEDEEKP